MPAGVWITIVLFVISIGLSGIGILLVFVLRGIRDNQVTISRKVSETVKDLRSDIAQRSNSVDMTILDNHRYARHSIRTLYSELLALAKLCPEGDGVVRSIEKTMMQGEV